MPEVLFARNLMYEVHWRIKLLEFYEKINI